MEEALEAFRRHPRLARLAAEVGVLVLAGTDAGMIPHGLVRHEIEHLLNAGLPPCVALGAGSWSARGFLGLAGIEEGAPADLIAFADDPRQGAEVLSRPVLRILDGRLLDERTSAGWDGQAGAALQHADRRA